MAEKKLGACFLELMKKGQNWQFKWFMGESNLLPDTYDY